MIDGLAEADELGGEEIDAGADLDLQLLAKGDGRIEEDAGVDLSGAGDAEVSGQGGIAGAAVGGGEIEGIEFVVGVGEDANVGAEVDVEALDVAPGGDLAGTVGKRVAVGVDVEAGRSAGVA